MNERVFYVDFGEEFRNWKMTEADDVARFTLTRDQVTRADLWHHEHRKLWSPRCDGESVAYQFHDGSGIGRTELCYCWRCGEGLDLTNYTTW